MAQLTSSQPRLAAEPGFGAHVLYALLCSEVSPLFGGMCLAWLAALAR